MYMNVTQSYTLHTFTKVLVNLDPIANIHIVKNSRKKLSDKYK